VPNFSLCGNRVVVVGGGSGIGRAVALRVAEAGAQVYVLGRREHALLETAEQAACYPGSVLPLPCDASVPEKVDEAFARIERDGPVPLLVHSAASVNYVPARVMTPENFRQVVDFTLGTAVTTISRWARPLIDAGTPGVAVAVTSAMASLGTPGLAHSAAGKADIEAYVKSVAREWAPHGVRVNAVGPGFFPVEKSQRLWADADASGRLRALIGLDRLGTLDEIVGPILFLLSDLASYITGETLAVDGGYRLQPDVFPSWTYEASSAIPGSSPVSAGPRA
jgi:NAD(P)-dependent dehydrogenase (short-subunit alcohol dehydrogenase family)